MNLLSIIVQEEYLFRKALPRFRLKVAKIQKIAQQTLFKIFKNKSSSYLFDLIPDSLKFDSTWGSQIKNISNIKSKDYFFERYF